MSSVISNSFSKNDSNRPAFAEEYPFLKSSILNEEEPQKVLDLIKLYEHCHPEYLYSTHGEADLKTPLHFAVVCLPQIVPSLIEALIKTGNAHCLIAEDCYQCTPLHFVEWGEHLNCPESAEIFIEALCENGLEESLIAQDFQQNTPLHKYMWTSSSNLQTITVLINTLIEKGQESALYAQNENGNTPLHLALDLVSEEIRLSLDRAKILIQALFASGNEDKIQMTNHQGMTPLDLVPEDFRREILDYIDSLKTS